MKLKLFCSGKAWSLGDVFYLSAFETDMMEKRKEKKEKCLSWGKDELLDELRVHKFNPSEKSKLRSNKFKN